MARAGWGVERRCRRACGSGGWRGLRRQMNRRAMKAREGSDGTVIGEAALRAARHGNLRRHVARHGNRPGSILRRRSGHRARGWLLELKRERLPVLQHFRVRVLPVVAARDRLQRQPAQRLFGGDEEVFLVLALNHAGVKNAVDVRNADEKIIGRLDAHRLRRRNGERRLRPQRLITRGRKRGLRQIARCGPVRVGAAGAVKTTGATGATSSARRIGTASKARAMRKEEVGFMLSCSVKSSRF